MQLYYDILEKPFNKGKIKEVEHGRRFSSKLNTQLREFCISNWTIQASMYQNLSHPLSCYTWYNDK